MAPQTGSGGRYMGQQNSPVPSPYTPQSPAPGYIQQYPHQQPPSYNQTQQIQGETLHACARGERVSASLHLINSTYIWVSQWKSTLLSNDSVLFFMCLLLLHFKPPKRYTRKLLYTRMCSVTVPNLQRSAPKIYCVHSNFKLVIFRLNYFCLSW